MNANVQNEKHLFCLGRFHVSHRNSQSGRWSDSLLGVTTSPYQFWKLSINHQKGLVRGISLKVLPEKVSLVFDDVSHLVPLSLRIILALDGFLKPINSLKHFPRNGKAERTMKTS